MLNILWTAPGVGSEQRQAEFDKCKDMTGKTIHKISRQGYKL